MRPCSLRSSLVLAALIAALSAVAAGAGLLTAVLVWPGTPARLLRSELLEEVRHLDAGLQTRADGGVRVVLDLPAANVYDAMPKDTAFLVLDAQGRELAHSIEGPALQALRGMPPEASTLHLDNGARPLQLQVIQSSIVRDGYRYTVRIARSERLVFTLADYAAKLYLRAGVTTAVLTLAFFMIVVFLMISRLLRPVRRASEAAARIGPRNLSIRLRSDGLPTELAPLIDALNLALTRLEDGFRVQQDFLATAAHELKTPLALLQAEIELGATADPETLLRDTALMARQVNQLLHLAEVSEGHNYRFVDLSLGTAAADAIDYLSRMAEQRQVRLRLDRAGGDLQVHADSGALFVLLKNLLENAIHHAPPGSTVLLHLGPRSVSVQDEGDGIPDGEVPHLFRRFWRGAGGRQIGGAGLGLAICREICLAHGWTIAFDGVHAGRGARFVVAIPRAEAAV